MVGNKLHNMFFGSAILFTAAMGTLAIPRLAASPAFLFVAAQIQMATGHTSDGLALMNRLAQGTSKTQPSDKPNPARPVMNCKLNVQPRTLRMAPAKYVAPKEVREIPPFPPSPATNPMFQPVAQRELFDHVSGKMISLVPTRAEVERGVRRIQIRLKHSVRQQHLMKEAALRAALSNLQRSNELAKLENASQQVQFRWIFTE